MKHVILSIAAFLFSFPAFAQVGAITGTLSGCAGQVISLSDTTAGGTWSSSSTGIVTVGAATGVVTGIVAGTAVISYTATAGTATVVVTINASPGPIEGQTLICLGSAALLSDPVPGGTWSSSAPAIVSIGSTGVVYGAIAGLAMVSYTLPSGCYATQNIFVNAPPTPILGASALCAGTTITLTDGVTGGTWSSANVAVASINIATGVVAGISPGTTPVSYTLGTGCSVLAVVTVTTTPGAISGTFTVCEGATAGLTDVIGGGTWSSSDASVASVSSASAIVTGATPGTAVITYSLSAGCYSTAVETVIVCTCSGTPAGGVTTAADTLICYGLTNTIGLSGATVSTAVSNQWQSSSDGVTWANIAGASSATYVSSATVSQYYRCMLTCSSSGLSAYSAPVYVHVTNTIGAHSIVSLLDTVCNQAHFYLSACGLSASYSVATSFGDGSSSTTALTGGVAWHADVYHTYAAAGTYTVKQVLLMAGAAVDSVTFSYEYLYCNILPVKFYFDANSNCAFDAGEVYNTLPQYVEIDSNGIVTDTVSVTSGLYYHAFGPVGTVYGFRVLPIGGLIAPCLTAGVLYDTVSTYVTYDPKYVALNCAPSTSFDLSVSASQTCGRHREQTTITVSNTHCNSVVPVVTMIVSPKYNTVYGDTYPAPTSVAGNVLTWVLSPLTAGSSRVISVHLERTLTWLIPGDTIMTHISVGPLAGDIDTNNNSITRCDTVNASYDPNNMAVSPQGYVLPCTQLQYHIMFENTGNDTAHNISVLDTLSDNADISSLSVVEASAIMNTSIISYGAHKIVRFDFPNINLLDSAHHNECNGMVIFNVKAKTSLADGAAIVNEAGIYFDDNPVVMTNAVQNTIGISPITGLGTVCAGAFDTLINATTGGTWSSSNATGTIAGGVVTAVSRGIDTISYSVSNSCASRTAIKIVSINDIPVVGPIGGTAVVCAGGNVTLSDTTAGGAWSSGSGGVAASAGGGVINGVATGVAIITYTSSNSCGTGQATYTITVNPNVTPSLSIAAPPADTVCAGFTVTFMTTNTNGGTAPVFEWLVNGLVIMGSTASTFSYIPASGDVVTAIMTSNAQCAWTDTASNSVSVYTVPELVPSLVITSHPGFAIPAGQPDTLIAIVTNGGASPTYQWLVNGTVIAGATNAEYISSSFSNYDSVTCTVVSSSICSGLSTFNSVFISVLGIGAVPVRVNGHVTLYPNPANSELNVAWENWATGPNDVIIADVAGREVYRSAIMINGATGNARVGLPDLTDGIYLVTIRSGSSQYHTKLEIKK